MIKRSFIGLFQPQLRYDTIGSALPKIKAVRPRKSVQILVEGPMPPAKSLLLKTGDKVKAGQKLQLTAGNGRYTIAPVAGVISAIEPHIGNFGRTYTAITITIDSTIGMDDRFQSESGTPSMAIVRDYLSTIPGLLPSALSMVPSEKEPVIHTLVVLGMDSDLLVNTRQYIVKSETAALKNGIRLLKELTGIEKIIMAVPETLSQDAMATGAQVKTLHSAYPSALPRLIVKEISGKPVPAGKTCEETGFCLISVETVASLAKAFENGAVPQEKLLTVIDKRGQKSMVSALIGTPLKDVFDSLNILINEGDRLINGGPMTGESIYTEFSPILPDMDAVHVQDKDAIPLVENSYCINCGECVRICPVNVPVNLLVRFLEAGKYDEARDEQDLDACVECGLCSYVCTARIPIFQYIRLAKYELARIQAAEAENA